MLQNSTEIGLFSCFTVGLSMSPKDIELLCNFLKQRQKPFNRLDIYFQEDTKGVIEKLIAFNIVAGISRLSLYGSLTKENTSQLSQLLLNMKSLSAINSKLRARSLVFWAFC